MSRTTTATSSASTAVGMNAKAAGLAALYAVSHADLFVRNLRLLDLDQKPDWPDISPQTLSSKDAQSTQKNRIKCVEWALYRLFEIYDPAEAQDKLRPFFPPLEPLQSLNLRGALYRCLNEIKKNGILGKDTLLRKSMLDECKGDKFVEILAVFSMAVLKRTLAETKQQRKRMTVVERLAAATSLSTEEEAQLVPLVLAHQSSLTKALQSNADVSERRRGLNELLDAKLVEMEERSNECVAQYGELEANQDPDVDSGQLTKTVQDNWLGNRKWLDVLLHGEQKRSEDDFWKASFEHIWSTGGDISETHVDAQHAGLLEDLESRIHKQQLRLTRWRDFYQQAKARGTASTDETDQNEANGRIDLQFDSHTQLKLSRSSEPRTPHLPTSQPSSHDVLPSRYDAAIAEMHERLDEAAVEKRPRNSTESPSQLRASHPRHEIASSPEFTYNVAFSSPVKAKNTPPSATRRPAEITPDPIPQHEVDVTPIKKQVPAVQVQYGCFTPPTEHDTPDHDRASESDWVDSPSGNLSQKDSDSVPATPQNHQAGSRDVADPTPIPTDPREALANRIISSVAEATPSPVKAPQPRLSLAERTRMSVARTSMFPSPLPEEEEDEEPESPTATVPVPQPIDRRTSLLERTRQSMSAMNLPQQPAKRRRSTRSRQSLFPVNQFETPRSKPKTRDFFDEADESVHAEETTPKNTLFEEDADYASVFKSRPRVAHSPPILTPIGAMADVPEETEDEPEGFSTMDLGDESSFLDPDAIGAESPSRRRHW